MIYCDQWIKIRKDISLTEQDIRRIKEEISAMMEKEVGDEIKVDIKNDFLKPYTRSIEGVRNRFS